MNTPRRGLTRATDTDAASGTETTAQGRPSPPSSTPTSSKPSSSTPTPTSSKPSSSTPTSSKSSSSGKPRADTSGSTKPGAPKPGAATPGAAKAAPGAAKAAKPGAEPGKPPKKGRKAKEVADAFASGKVTLGRALGLTEAQKDVMKRRAFALVQESKTELALPILEGLVALDPFDGWVLVALGGLLVDKGDYVVAEALLTRALEVTPGDVTAHAMRAEARVKQSKVQEAREDLQAIASADLSNPAVRRAKALEIALKNL